ncbi:MAG: TolC family protein [Bacteroidota bacterium]
MFRLIQAMHLINLMKRLQEIKKDTLAKGIVLLFFTLGSVTMLPAQTLEDYLQEASIQNPGIKAAYSRYEASLEKAKQPGLPDPEFQAGLLLKPMERFMGYQRTDLRLMQMFPWFGMLSAQQQEGQHMAQAQYWHFDEEKNQLLLEVKSTWYEMMWLQGELQLAEQTVNYLRQYESLALTQFQAGNSQSLPNSSWSSNLPSSTSQTSSKGMEGMATSSTPNPMKSGPMTGTTMSTPSLGMQAVLQLRLQINEWEAVIQQLLANKEVARMKFNQVLSRPMDASVTLPTTWENPIMEVEKKEYLERIRTLNPMIGMVAAERLALEQQEKMARLEGKPMLGLGVNYIPFSPRIDNGMSMGGQDMVMPMATLSLPIYRKKITSKINEVALNREAAKLDQEQTEIQLAKAWLTVFQNWEENERNLLLYQEQIALVKQQIELMEASFSAGNSSLSEVLQTQQILVEYQKKQLFAQYQQQLSIARLEALAPSPFLSN